MNFRKRYGCGLQLEYVYPEVEKMLKDEIANLQKTLQDYRRVFHIQRDKATDALESSIQALQAKLNPQPAQQAQPAQAAQQPAQAQQVAAVADGLLDSPPHSIMEELNKSDKDAIEKMIRQGIKGKDFEERVLRLTKNILTQFSKILYTRRGFWKDVLSTSSD